MLNLKKIILNLNAKVVKLNMYIMKINLNQIKKLNTLMKFHKGIKKVFLK